MRKRIGISLIEVLVAATVVGIVMMALGGYVVSTFGKTAYVRDRAFAMQKALQMMEEMAAYKPPTTTSPGVEKFAGDSYLLTTVSEVSPGAPVSGNIYQAGRYKYVRRITAAAVPGEPKADLVTVEIWYTPKKMTAFQDDTTPNGTAPMPSGPPLAVVSEILRGNIPTAVSQNNIDIYAISIENLPHIWRHKANDTFDVSSTDARNAFQVALTDLESAYPSINFRTHWITRLSIGRDRYYRPYVNSAAPLDNHASGAVTPDPLDSVYFYPGTLEAGSTDCYFDPQNINGDIAVGGAAGTVTTKGYYPLCDEFNNAVRYPEEFTSNGTPVSADSYSSSFTSATPLTDQMAFQADSATDSLSLRQLLEDMLTNTTGKYRNAIVVNLHGSLFPSIPLRNYSDAAIDMTDTAAAPDGTTPPDSASRRVVTHPRCLSYDTSGATAVPVILLTHTYMAGGLNTPVPMSEYSGSYSSSFDYATKVRVIIKGLAPYLAPAGSTSSGGTTSDVTAEEIAQADGSGPWNGYSYAWSTVGTSVTSSGNDVVVEYDKMFYDAYERSLVHNGGGNSNHQYFGFNESGANQYLLDGLQYFPDPDLPYLSVGNGSANNDGIENEPRNTAHGKLEFYLAHVATLPSRFTVVTQLYRRVGGWAGVDANDPANTRTYFWTCGPLTSLGSGSAIPRTAQLQLVGDPRENPYEDVRAHNLYNPYFKDFTQGNKLYHNANKDIKNDPSHNDSYIDYVNTDLLPADMPPAVGGLLDLLGNQTYDLSFSASHDAWCGTAFNGPAYLQLWRDAMLKNNLMFVNVSGEPLSLIGTGGDFAFAGGAHLDGLGEIKLSQEPYSAGLGPDDGPKKGDELYGGTSVPLVKHCDSSGWLSKPWVGELFPPGYEQYWAQHGNLPTKDANSSNYFERAFDVRFDSADADGVNNNWVKTVSGDTGFASLLNADDGVGPIQVIHQDDKSSSQTSTGSEMVKALLMANTLAGSENADYFYTSPSLLGSNAKPPEWGAMSPHLSMQWLDAAMNSNGYYKRDDGGTTEYSDSPILLTDSSGNQAVALATTFRPEQTTDDRGMLDTTVASMVGAYFDWTQQSLGDSNNKPISRLKITAPSNDANVSGTDVAVVWYSRWMRPDVTQFVPSNYLPNPAPTYDPNAPSGAALPVEYFLKVQWPNGSWHTAVTLNDPADVSCGYGIIPTVPAYGDTGTPSGPQLPTSTPGANGITAHWDSTTVPNGTCNLRLEEFRKSGTGVSDPLIPVNYGSYQITVHVDNASS